MAASYYYARAGKEHGPVSSTELKALAGAGQLEPTDLVWLEGSTQRKPAAKVKGLFAEQATLPTTVAADPPPLPSGATEPKAKPDLGVAARQQLDQVKSRLQPLVERYSREFAIEPRPLVAVAFACAGLIVLALATLMTWESYRTSIDVVMSGKPMVKSESYVGVASPEGKMTCVLALVALAAIVTAFFVKKWFAASLLIAAGAATCAFLVALSYDLKIGRYVAGELKSLSEFTRNMGTVADAKFIMEKQNFQFSGGTSVGLYLALLAALGAAGAFVYASLRKPQPVPFLQKQGAGPMLIEYGGLIGALGAAVLVGLIVYIARY